MIQVLVSVKIFKKIFGFESLGGETSDYRNKQIFELFVLESLD